MSRVALIGENSIGYISKLLDIWNASDCAVLIDWRIPFSVAVEMMKEADVSRCFIDEHFYKKIPSDLNMSIEFIPFKCCNGVAELLSDDIYEKFKSNYSKTEAVVIYSSGTTGKSKGIILSHYAINTNADAIIDYMKPMASDCISIVKTLSHSSTITGELLVALKTKMSMVVAPIIVPPRYILNNIEKFSVTMLCVNPTLLSLLSDEMSRANYNLKTIRTIYVSGSILSDPVYEKAHGVFDNIQIYNVYGLSEAGPRITAQRVDCNKSNSVGKPIKNVEIKIVNEQGSVIPNGEYGIIHVNTPSLFDGYIIGQNKHTSFYEGWHNTGDVGFMDANGELHIVNRLDDVIIIDSHKIYPSEVEKQIVEQSDVKECAVAKVELNGNEFIGCLYVSEKEIDRDIKERLKSKLLAYEIPRFFLRCDVLPQTLTGKHFNEEIKNFLSKCIIT